MNELRVFERPPKQRIWVVRGSGGDYMNHFLHRGVVAIGHLDGFIPAARKKENVISLDIERIEYWLRTIPEISQARATSHLHQISRFVEEINDGDLVVTVNSSNLAVGRVIGPAFVSRQPVVIELGDGSVAELPYKLRRQIAWGPTLRRSHLPYPVEASLYSHQTVFNIDEHWETIYHLLYPYFHSEDNLYFSIDITKTGELLNLNVARLFVLLSEIETIARVNSQLLKRHSLDDLLVKLAAQGLLGLSTKAGFMSPGSIWSKLKIDSGSQAYTYIVCLLLLFSGFEVDKLKVGGAIEVNGLKVPAVVDKDALIAAVERYAEKGYDELIVRLGLTQPKHNTKPLEKPQVPDPNIPDRQEVVLVHTRRKE